MRLKQFIVANFLSVIDSGWIETEDVTALIGAHDSGRPDRSIGPGHVETLRRIGIAERTDYR